MTPVEICIQLAHTDTRARGDLTEESELRAGCGVRRPGELGDESRSYIQSQLLVTDGCLESVAASIKAGLNLNQLDPLLK